MDGETRKEDFQYMNSSRKEELHELKNNKFSLNHFSPFIKHLLFSSSVLTVEPRRGRVCVLSAEQCNARRTPVANNFAPWRWCKKGNRYNVVCEY